MCSAEDLPFDDATFDSVSVRFGYMFFPDVAKATAEFVRVLKPGGRLCSSVWIKPEENPWTSIFMQAIATEVGAGAARPGRPEHVPVRGAGMRQLLCTRPRGCATLRSGTSTWNS